MTTVTDVLMDITTKELVEEIIRRHEGACIVIQGNIPGEDIRMSDLSTGMPPAQVIAVLGMAVKSIGGDIDRMMREGGMGGPG